MLLVHTGGGNGSVAGNMWVENSHIEKGCVKIVSPEPICLHIESIVSILTAVACIISSPSRGCRWGSADTLGHTCDSMPAMMFLSSLCLRIGKPPWLQLRACSTLNCFPHAQVVGNLSGFHPYLRHSPSRNAPLWRLNPCSTIGRIVSQWEAPFS